MDAQTISENDGIHGKWPKSRQWPRMSAAVNLPNALTVGRIFLVPILVVVLLADQSPNRSTWWDAWQLFGVSKEILGALIFGIASLTDWLDGYLARRRGQVTEFGQWMDPLADKLLVTAALVSLVQMGLAPAWMVAVILGREFVVTILRTIVHARGQALPASPLGKVKLVAQVVAILVLILGQGHMRGFFVVGQIALWVATIAALVSAVDYFRRFPPANASRVQSPESRVAENVHLAGSNQPPPRLRRSAGASAKAEDPASD
jgi:CDP-diacylglycerol--glycerol-3-phosphate 3-phosphatidyltransferase